jgi:uncharacterized protein (DUF433 family)
LNTTIQRFNAKIEKDAVSECWIWIASTAGSGYGQFRIPGTRRNVYAHRMAWELRNGTVPAEKAVCHSCDNPRCVNPDHLFLGDQSVNMKDMAAKSRHLFGEKNSQSKLTAIEVHAIHEASASGQTQSAIAKRFRIGQMTVCRILRGERWHHIFKARQQSA